MRAITIRQPYAWAVAYMLKGVENRNQPDPWKSAVGQRIAIHAAQAHYCKDPEDGVMTDVEVLLLGEQCLGRKITWEERDELDVRSAVIATAFLADVHHSSTCEDCSPWAMPDSWHLVLTDVQPLSRPVPARGALGLWKVPDNVERAVLRLSPAPSQRSSE